MATWYYEQDGESKGPFGEAAFFSLVSDGTVSEQTLVWHAGMAEWMPLASAPGRPSPPSEKPKLMLRHPTRPPETEIAATSGASLKPEAAAPGDSEAESPSQNKLTLKPRTFQENDKVIAQGQTERVQEYRRVSNRAEYDGKGKEIFPLYLKNIVLTLLTFGIYKFWAQVTMRKYHYRHVLFHGGNLDYHATGGERFIGFLKGMALLSPIALLLWYVFSNLAVGLEGEESIDLAVTMVMILGFLLRPLIIVGSMAFHQSRTSWNHIRFRFTGKIRSLYGLYFRDALFIFLTFGIYMFWHQINLMRFRRTHSTLGGVAFGYSGKGGELFALHFLGYLATLLTLGLYAPWYYAKLHRYHIDQTTFQGMRFYSNLSGGMVLKTLIVCILLTFFTLGLGMPWAVARWKGMLVNTVFAKGTVNLNHLQGEYDQRAGAFAEGLGTAGEAFEALGQIFGG